MLGLMCLANPKKAVRYAIICTIASVAGGMLGYLIGFFLYESVGLALLGALGLTDAFPPAACYLREYGAELILIKGATPIPFKLLGSEERRVGTECVSTVIYLGLPVKKK